MADDIGYLKYSGKLVQTGAFDARKSAQALLGFDKAIRFFVRQQAPEIAELNYELPVRIEHGSWIVSISSDVVSMLEIGGGLILTNYLASAAGEMAKNDFRDVGLKDIFRKSLISIQWMIRIGKHLGSVGVKKFDDVKFRNNSLDVGIKNALGEYLFIPKLYFDMYIVSGSKLLSKISELVEEERELAIGVVTDGKASEERVSKSTRHIFTQEEIETDDTLLPELEHGQKVRLEGEVTRGNEKTNTIGLQYRGHILTCEPESGSVVRFKPSIFLKARVSGTISRLDQFGRLGAKKPRIIVRKIEPLEKDENMSLFD